MKGAQLVDWARMSGGVAGRDEGLCAKCEAVERLTPMLRAALCASPAPSPDEVERALIAFNESWGEFALDGTERCRTAMRAALAAPSVPSPDEVERVAAAIRYEDDCGHRL